MFTMADCIRIKYLGEMEIKRRRDNFDVMYNIEKMLGMLDDGQTLCLLK